MAIRVVRLGTPRLPNEGLRLGTVRRPPRGVKKEDFASGDWYDLWLPDLSPTAATISWAQSEPWTSARWEKFARAYRREMRAPEQQRLIALLAALSHDTNFSVGCYCEDASRCHRSVLALLLAEAGAEMQV
ncbi:MAG TPA: DUF488 family protein [Gemmatimonadaceae bacterium]|nr:DUF488 family protein [Gemmatimonadaceae bacterium]